MFLTCYHFGHLVLRGWHCRVGWWHCYGRLGAFEERADLASMGSTGGSAFSVTTQSCSGPSSAASWSTKMWGASTTHSHYRELPAFYPSLPTRPPHPILTTLLSPSVPPHSSLAFPQHWAENVTPNEALFFEVVSVWYFDTALRKVINIRRKWNKTRYLHQKAFLPQTQG